MQLLSIFHNYRINLFFFFFSVEQLYSTFKTLFSHNIENCFLFFKIFDKFWNHPQTSWQACRCLTYVGLFSSDGSENKRALLYICNFNTMQMNFRIFRNCCRQNLFVWLTNTCKMRIWCGDGSYKMHWYQRYPSRSFLFLRFLSIIGCCGIPLNRKNVTNTLKKCL